MEKMSRATIMKSGLLSVLLLIFSFIVITAGIAGESGSSLRPVPEDIETSDGITTGYVIYFGRPLSPPYKFTMESGEIFINGLPIVPKKEKKESSKIEYSEAFLKKYELGKAISKNYADWATESGVKKAKSKLIDFLEEQPLIDHYEWKSEETIAITYTDGDSELGLLHIARMRREREKRFSQSERDQMQLNKKTKLLKGCQDDLKKNGIIAFGRGYITYIPGRYTNEYKAFIRDTLSTSLSDEEKPKILREKFSKELVKDLIANQRHW